ncbi:MAG: hypothetical protein GX306_04710 [Clostridiales bacterium]|nr:hypothetical protein [Clostridiales bacterium]
MPNFSGINNPYLTAPNGDHFFVYNWACPAYNGTKIVCDVKWIFPDDFVGLSEATSIFEGEKDVFISRFRRDENGVITGMVFKVVVDH